MRPERLSAVEAIAAFILFSVASLALPAISASNAAKLKLIAADKKLNFCTASSPFRLYFLLCVPAPSLSSDAGPRLSVGISNFSNSEAIAGMLFCGAECRRCAISRISAWCAFWSEDTRPGIRCELVAGPTRVNGSRRRRRHMQLNIKRLTLSLSAD